MENMAEAILYGFVEEILKNLGSTALNEIASAWGFKARLEKLKNSTNTIKDVLLDAEEKQAHSHAVRGWLERLTTVVYAADDLFDEVATIASQKQLKRGYKLTKTQVQSFFSRFDQIMFAFNVSRKIKRIRQDLEDIIKDSAQFAFVSRSLEQEGVVNTDVRNETYSFVDAEEVIGRDDDKKAVLDILLSFTSTDDVYQHTEEAALPVIPIVGMGGLGKTTLAQLVYNDPQVENHYELRLWVCVSDVFDMKEIIKKTIMSATNKEIQKLEMDQLQGLLRKEVGDKKYLLVLDDVWNENREHWLKLRGLLKIGRKGSSILVTTRSRKVAKIMGTVPSYELQGLLVEKSWDLFEKMAFEPGQAQLKPHLVTMGKDIVKKCANVPLAIRTLGSLLYGQGESKWLSFKDTSLANISEKQNNIMNILKLSYHHLWSPLKNCFAYCALFPKDFYFNKERLKLLWIAEGFIIPKNNSQSLEELAEEYFLILLQRCFFQDIKRNEWGDIKSCSMHDLMHDLAQEVAGNKYKIVKLGERYYDNRIHHLSFDYQFDSLQKIPSDILDLKVLRTFLLPEQMRDESIFSKSICQQVITRLRCLRVLDLHKLQVKSLPTSVGKLIHLRYIDLSWAAIEELPQSITELHNLQTLLLNCCFQLKELPTDIGKLANLRCLVLDQCYSLNYMPPGLGELTTLRRISHFMIGHKNFLAVRGELTTAKFSDLKNLNELKGSLRIEYFEGEPATRAKEANMNSKHGLTELEIHLRSRSLEDNEAVLEGLKPHSNLRKLYVFSYTGHKPPTWAMTNNLCISLPNLVEISLFGRSNCQEIPMFRKLQFLKRLTLSLMNNVEYMESIVLDDSGSSTEYLFFPSLEELTLMDMDSLKGWWKGRETIDNDNTSANKALDQLEQQLLMSMSFNNLSILRIEGCPNLTSLPGCPIVEDLTLLKVNNNLSVSKTLTISSRNRPRLKKLVIDDVEKLISLTEQHMHQLSSLAVQSAKLVSTFRLEEAFKNISSLRSLEFAGCSDLRCITKCLEHLTALESLTIWYCAQPDLAPNEHGMPWKAFRFLRSLELHVMPKVVNLPSGLQHLQNLHSLSIGFAHELMEIPEWISCLSSLEYMHLYDCPKLTYLPDSFHKLTALNHLKITKCPGLAERCRGPNGGDWPKIQHVQLVTIQEDFE